MTPEAALALALSCKDLPRHIAYVMFATAGHESNYETRAVHLNKNGTRDWGIAQVNDINRAWTGLTDPFDPCANILAGARVMIAHYNGNASDKEKIAYTNDILRRLRLADDIPPSATPVVAGPPPDDSLHDSVHLHRALPPLPGALDEVR